MKWRKDAIRELWWRFSLKSYEASKLSESSLSYQWKEFLVCFRFIPNPAPSGSFSVLVNVREYVVRACKDSLFKMWLRNRDCRNIKYKIVDNNRDVTLDKKWLNY